MRTHLMLVGLWIVSMTAAFADENDWFRPLGLPPKASPRRISGGEAIPPLPLPATPLRRTERKRQPRPPTVAGKIVWGETAMFSHANGQATQISDWNLCPADLQQLLAKAGRWFGLTYSHEVVPLSEFHGDPERLPLALFNGGRSVKPTTQQLATLRSYVLAGGMILFDSIAGSPYFYESAKQVVADAFPEFQLRTIPPDHPIYHMLYDVDTVSYPKNLESNEPFLEAIYVGCRAAVVISKYGLGCAWDDHEVPMIDQAVYYDVDSGNKLGLNLLAYAVGYATAGREEAKPELFGVLDEKDPTDEFVFAQIRHEGAWNVHPGGAAALLQRLRRNTALRVSLKRVPVTPGRDDISRFPFVYLSGLDDFSFDSQAVAALRGFLKGAGTLLINNGLGMQTFDQAVRRELKKILPDSSLAAVPPTHPVYSSVFGVNEVRYTPAVVSIHPDLNSPLLEGISINGDLRIIYSPFDLESAWQGCEHPLAKAVQPHDGMQLGVNIIMYAMTH